MNLKDFIKHVYPPYHIFNRKDRGFVWKLSKWTGIRAAFVFYKLGISANFLNVITYFIIVFAFYLILKIEQNLFFQPLIGLSMLYLSIWFDFVDGSIARANNKSSKIGHYLDDFGADLSRLIIIILFGYLSNIEILLILSILSGFVIVYLIPNTLKLINFGKFRPLMILIYSNSLSLISVRFMTIVLPASFLALAYYNVKASSIGIYGAGAYIFLATVWILFCIPHYASEDNIEKKIKDH